MSRTSVSERPGDTEETERTREAEIGRRRIRREDRPLLTGDAEYTDDVATSESLHVAFHRSQFGHARIESVDTSGAEERDGVVAVYDAEDLTAAGVDSGERVEARPPEGVETEFPLLAEDRVRYAGEPIAVVVAEDRYVAGNAVEAIDVEYERLEAVTDVDAALEDDAPVLHDEHSDNTAFDWEFGDPDATEEAFEAADRTVSLELENQRLVPNAIEPRSVFAEYDADDDALTVRLSTQVPHTVKSRLAALLPLDEEQIRAVAPDVGGGFGSKGGMPYSEEPVAAWVAFEHGRPATWVSTRTESFQSDHHGRDVRCDGEIAVDEDGTIRGLRADARFNVGAYVVYGSTTAGNFKHLISSQYDIPAISGRSVGALTNTTPTAPYRGAGRPESVYVIERLVDAAAGELGIDPVELRRRNQIPSDAFPFETAVGTTYHSGNYQRALEKAVEEVGYEELRERQAALRRDGRYLGVGTCCFVENTGTGPGLPEWGEVELREDGSLLVRCGTADHGQGHGTTFAQVLSDELGVDYEDVEVEEGDTDSLPEGTGTFGSRSAPVGVSALVEAAETVREEARGLAADRLDVAASDLVFDDGVFHPEGDDEAAVALPDLAAAAGGSLEASSKYDPEKLAYAFGVHFAVVEVDPETGEVDLERYLAVDDVGVQFNPQVVEGQLHGGVVQGIGQALYEGAEYNENGVLVSGSLQDYALPRAMQVPDIEVGETVTPCPHNPTGAKGAGESGAIASPPAVVNAVVDALRPFGVESVEMPLTSETVWRAVEDARDD